MASGKQTVFRLKKRDSIDDLQSYQEPIPEIDGHEVLVKVRAVTLNFRDLAIATGKYPAPVKESVIPCSDAAGEVVKVGKYVLKLKEGDYVVGNFDVSNLYGPQQNMNNSLGGPLDGVLRQYIALPEIVLTKIPKSTSMNFLQMAALVCTGVTAWNALYGNNPLKPGQVVLFQGTGGVSMTGLILAKAAGAVTIVTSSSDDKLDFVKKEYGADYTINYKKTPNWAEEALKITGGRGVDVIFDNAGGSGIQQSLDAVAYGGIIACIGFLSSDSSNMPDVGLGALLKGCVVRGILVGSKQLLDDLVTFVVNKKLAIPISKSFGFSREEVISAYKHLQSGDHIGKVGIVVD